MTDRRAETLVASDTHRLREYQKAVQLRGMTQPGLDPSTISADEVWIASLRSEGRRGGREAFILDWSGGLLAKQTRKGQNGFR